MPVARRAATGLAVLGLAAVCSLGPLPASAAATTLYVGGAGCTDTGTGTQLQPYCTISAAAKVAAAGQTVQVASGTYPEMIRPARSGTPGSPVTFTAAPGATPVVTGGTHAFDLSYRSYVTVNGFTSTTTSSSGMYLKSSDHVVVTASRVTAAGQQAEGLTAYGIYVSASTSSLVQGNVTFGNSAAGIYLTGGSTGITVDGNESYANFNGYQRAANGIDVRAPGNVITRNRTHDNEDTGLQAYPGGDGNLIAGNASYHNKGFTTTIETNCDKPLSGAAGCITGDHGIDDYGVYDNTIIGNTIYDNVSAGINVEGVASTWLAAPVGPTDTTLTVGGATSFPPAASFDIMIGSERMTVVAGQGTTTWTVLRGVGGTTPAAHAAGCDGTTCTPKNLNVARRAGFTIENNVSADNAINCPNGTGGVQAACNRTKGEIRVDQYSWAGTQADHDLIWTSSTAYTYVYTWGNPMYKTLTSLQTATGQELHATQADPLWADAAHGDFHLMAGSPAIDSADSSPVGEQTTDLQHLPRVDDPATADTGTGPRTYDDRGAYEFQAHA